MTIDKLALLVPIYKQAHHWDSIVKGIESNSNMPGKVYALMDRASDDEYELVKSISDMSELNIEVIRCPIPPHYLIKRQSSGEPFYVGYIRNYGIDIAITEGFDEFIFIDGDCIPQSGLFISHSNKLSATIPVLSVGRRREQKFRWKDQRELSPEFTHLDIFRKEGMLINNPELITSCVIVWSCNIGMNLALVKLLKKFNMKYYSRAEVFCSEFLGEWGGEDGFLGIQSWFVKAFITTVGEPKCGVQHIDHPRPKDKYTVNHKEYFNEQLNRLRVKTKLHPLNLDFFSY
jgi:hypothetical protein